MLKIRPWRAARPVSPPSAHRSPHPALPKRGRGLSGDRTLTPRELNRALLARQFLLERSALPLVSTVERVGGLQTQYAPSGYIGLWSRMRNFRRDALTEALEQRRVIQGTLLRSTIHMVSARDYWLFLAAIRQPRQDWWRRVTRHQISELDMEAAVGALREQLAKGPRRADELKGILAERGLPPFAFGGVAQWLEMVRVPPSGTWEQRRADLYGLADAWIRPAPHAEPAALEHVIRRYLGAFGPASVREIADWAGIPHAKLTPVLEPMSLRHFRDEKGKDLIDLPRAPLPDANTPAPSVSCPHGTPRCWCMRAAPRSFPSRTARRSSIPRRRTPFPPFSSMAPWRAGAASRAVVSSSSRSSRSRGPSSARSTMKHSGWGGF